jgi:GntR family transcriptional repressor for pyruvate dehydrogenase complex
MYQPLQSFRLYEQMASQIKERIVRNEIKVGELLPNERDLAIQFGVSRTVVREAIKSLEKERLVQVRHGRGTFVINRSQQAVRDSLNTLISFDQSDDLENLLEVRTLLEPGIAELAAKRATVEQIAALKATIEAMDAAMDDAEKYIAADNDFHLILARATGNDLLMNLVEPIVGLLTQQRKKIFLVNGGTQRGQVHHKKILDAIQEHKKENARLAMIQHLAQVRQDSSDKRP